MKSGLAVDESGSLAERQLVLETPNPLDMSLDELAGLAKQIQEFLAANGLNDVSVTVRGEEPEGAGNYLLDILNIILPSAEAMKEDVFKGMVALTVAYMRTRFKKKYEGMRTRQIRFRLPNGVTVFEVTINSFDADPKFSTPEEGSKTPEEGSKDDG